MTQDVNIFYSGGSGGFFCLHLLLLTGQYHCVWHNQEQDFEKIFQHQWNIVDKSKWKNNEIWPNNRSTYLNNFTRKIYFTCNRFVFWSQWPGTKIVLYTDIKTQVCLAESKQANWFYRDNKIVNFIKRYNIVRGTDWPDCNSIAEFNNLPPFVRDECINVFHLELGSGSSIINSNMLAYKDDNVHSSSIINSNTLSYNNDNVYNLLIEQGILEQADIVVKLQDLIKTNGTVLFDQLGIEGNDRCQDFVKHWLSLHTEEQLTYLLT